MSAKSCLAVVAHMSIRANCVSQKSIVQNQLIMNRGQMVTVFEECLEVAV